MLDLVSERGLFSVVWSSVRVLVVVCIIYHTLKYFYICSYSLLNYIRAGSTPVSHY